MEKTIYKKGDIVAFISNQPTFQLNGMIGPSRADDIDIEPTEHVGYVEEVVNDNFFLIVTMRPVEGIRCIISSFEIQCQLEEGDLEEGEMDEIESFLEQADNTYIIKEKPIGGNYIQKSCYIVRKAMQMLFPEDIIESIESTRSVFLKEDLFDSAFEKLNDLRGMVDDTTFTKWIVNFNRLVSLLRHSAFKEYYTVDAEIRTEGSGSSAKYKVAVSTIFDKVVIIRNEEEEKAFHRRLGPEYDAVIRGYSAFQNNTERKHY